MTMNATDQDGDSLTYTVSTAATKGATTVSGNSIIYTPNANYNGADSFVVTAPSVYSTTTSPSSTRVESNEPSADARTRT